jgi:O-antigen/teichoic acid export membrane protein
VYSVLKIVLLFPLVFLEQQGILLSWYASALISAFIVLVYLIKQIEYKVSFSDFVNTFKKLGVYSFFTYVGRFINGMPSMVLPLLIIETSSASFSAYYYIVIMIYSTLSIIPMSIARSCFAESSSKEHYLNKYLKTSFKFSYLAMIPLVIITIALGKFVLLLFGQEYAQYGYPLLVILSIVSLIAVIRFVLEIIFSVKKQLGKIVIKSLVYSVSMVIAGYFLMERYALVGVGIAFLIANITTVIALILMNLKTINEIK